MKTAWIFPGQGSQAVGMGVELQETAIGKAKFEQAQEILGWSVVERCQGDEVELSRTLYTQPCLYVIESILVDLLLDKGQSPDLVAGHSLGEYSALYAARVFDFATGLQLVQRRAQLMDTASGGKMAALMQFNREALETAIAANPDVVLANDNSEQQVVISGTPEAVDSILSQVKIKRAVPLKVSGAFHSPLMAQPAQQFEVLLGSSEFKDATIPVLSNVDPSPTHSGTILKERLVKQMTGSVRWREIMLQLSQEGITHSLEIGPGKVLTGLIKRACPEIALGNISGLADI
ncbi:malonyl CoA-acyl carrier protein transacylase [Rippkaea orientalis PCC 8801]|uniref:Malonyl CoA-acyl carrier protein transacylase n=1 Tax=Rippkaea orientalis (strain PCC 8801 / RF-1) TaxID=41431 RepID=B7JX01_RIPO1|nr:ACP S-malonyltransferase [Rippkaea orientalis]ACK65850.1 malonyl CoA-acyl carrier protein transacylase [Rippkaea orientalis PCC 8801]